MSTRSTFNKHIFALLLSLAKGQERSWRQFSADCDISYVQMRKLATERQDNPPREKLIQKLAQNAVGGITLSDLLFAAGLSGDKNAPQKPTPSDAAAREAGLFTSRYLSLSKGQRSMVNAFIDFLSERR